MSDSLYLRKGLLANLADAPKVPGAISITTDERAMYLDLSESERIRIGDFIQVANKDELFSTKYQPYSTTAFYYVEDINGLYKYTGTTWKLVNEKTEIKDVDLSGIEASITANAINITTNAGNIATLNTELAGLTATVTTLGTDLSAEISRAIAAEGVNAQNIKDEKTRAEFAETTLQTNINSLAGDVTNITNDLSGEITRAKAAEAEIIKDINDLIVEDTRLADLIDDIDTAFKTADNALNVAIADVASNLNTVSSNVSSLSTDISSETSRATQAEADLAKDISDLQAEDTRLAGLVTALDTNYKAADSALDASLTNLGTRIGAAETAITGVQTNVTQAFQDADAALKNTITAEYEEYVTNAMSVADAMKFMGAISEASQVPTTGVRIGHTYKINGKFTHQGETYLVGDLMIADADQAEDDETYSGTWTHVTSGFEDDYAAKLDANAVTKTITLLDGVDTGRGSLEFVDTYSATEGGLQFTMKINGGSEIVGENVSVSAALVWGSF